MVVVVHANVLFPLTLRDTMLRAAAAGFYQLRWSAQILDEVERNLVADEFLCHLFNLQPDAFTELLREQASDLVRRPVTFDELLERLGRVVPDLTSRVRRHRSAVR